MDVVIGTMKKMKQDNLVGDNWCRDAIARIVTSAEVTFELSQKS